MLLHNVLNVASINIFNTNIKTLKDIGFALP